MYTFSALDFDEKEIEQVTEIVKYCNTGNHSTLFDNYALDLRKVKRYGQVFRWAKSRGFITQGKEITDYAGNHPWYVQKKGLDRWYVTPYANTDMLFDVPIETLWRIVQPIVTEGSGFYTITSNPLWQQLGIFERGSRSFEEKYGDSFNTRGVQKFVPFMRDVLNFLARRGYIIFQYAGSIWQVTIMDRYR